MVERKFVFKGEKGLNAEMATQFVQIASKYTSRIMIIYEDKEVNAKSIMSLLALAIAPGDEFIIRARGEDEECALKDLARFIENSG
ncbi:hypothetical protein BBF96_01875 [Anoxybacter fermentans]|uniref:HPr domain-containing protein n=1 Tax=Anoxybacter fermentans TaxID=1323375 RepID=A0A3S9SVB8_9FIRM|nr:HPr family phosphocarrier protein [Anoxybacter fermentans]AZR72253.1 hypothetical protein BBF96_01875 [Anoxybacter fermentans]